MVMFDNEVVAHALLRDTKNVWDQGFDKKNYAFAANGDQYVLRMVSRRNTIKNYLLIDCFVGHHHRVWIWPRGEDEEKERTNMYKSIIESL